MRDANGESSRSVPSREQHGRQPSRLTLQMSYGTTLPHGRLSMHTFRRTYEYRRREEEERMRGDY